MPIVFEFPSAGSISIAKIEAENNSPNVLAGDLALVWDEQLGNADLQLIALDLAGDVTDLATDRGLTTAVLISLFTDRRAEDDDVPPSGDPMDRRGWWGDQFAAVEGDRIGSRLWLLDRSKNTNEARIRAEEYVREALAWMIEDKVCSSIDVAVTTPTKAVLLIAIGLNRPGKDQVAFKFAHAWNAMEAA